MLWNKLRNAAIAFFSITYLLSGCSQDNYSLVNRTFHNTTAHYNAYFLAREKMKEVELQVWQANMDDYNKVLKIYPTLDKNIHTTIAPGLEEVIKMAALPVTKHKNSHWVDDSYILIGKTRLYQEDFPLAQETFKYVNTKSEDVNARHAALILLMRTFIVMADYDHGDAVFNYLKKEKLNRQNSRDFFLTRAYQVAALEDYKKEEAYLTLAVPHIRKKEYKARIHFIIAQINQMMDNNKEAFINYTQTIKNNPGYELSFYAKLYRTQVSEVRDANDKSRVEKYFKKLLKDKKNEDYKDKIYYEMGMFQFKQNEIKKAIPLFEQSLSQKSKNTFQKALTYLRLGKIYYENLQQYETAKLYYDSTVAIWDPKDKEFRIISQRQKILQEFVTQLRIVQNEDSLQRLARMDSVTLNKFLDDMISAEERKRKNDEKKAKEAADREERLKFNAANNNATTQPAPIGFDNAPPKFYFYDPPTMVKGKAEFTKKWSSRPLEDNWRRAVKEKPINSNDPAASEKSTIDSTQTTQKVPEKTEDELRNETKTVYKKDIPFSEVQMAASNKNLKGGLYNLGKIYNLKLKESGNAITTFEKYIEKFPNTDSTTEVLYFLYLLYKEKPDEAKAAEYKDRILQDFPTSIFAKIIRNPNYLSDTKASNKEASKMYKEAFGLYKSGNYLQADSMINLIKNTFSDVDILDKLSFLQVMITGKTKNAIAYKYELESFIKTFNTSDIIPTAKEYLAVTDAFIAGKTKEGGILDSNAVRYNSNLEDVQYFGAAFPNIVKQEKILEEFRSFNLKNFKEQKLTAEALPLNDSTYFVLVNEFPDKNEAKRYLIEARNDKKLSDSYEGFKNALFVITPANLTLLNRSRYLDDYIRFYLEKYQ